MERRRSGDPWWPVVDVGGITREADVAVKDGRIAAVGKIAGVGAEETGRARPYRHPGLRRHSYPPRWPGDLGRTDATVLGDGVTTVVMGNCGVDLPPAGPRTTIGSCVRGGVEDIPFPVLSQGLPWNWRVIPTTWARWKVAPSMWISAASCRTWPQSGSSSWASVATNREPATEADIAAMSAIARRAAEAGARFTTLLAQPPHQRRPAHADPHRQRGGTHRHAMALAAAGGVLQFVSDFAHPKEEFGMLRRIALRQRPAAVFQPGPGREQPRGVPLPAGLKRPSPPACR